MNIKRLNLGKKIKSIKETSMYKKMNDPHILTVSASRTIRYILTLVVFALISIGWAMYDSHIRELETIGITTVQLPVGITEQEKQKICSLESVVCEGEKVTVKATPTKVAQRATGEIADLIRRIAREEGYGSPEYAIAIARCESGLRPTAVGDSGRSRGLWQIFRPAHPTITDSFAFDPELSTRWAIQKLKAGARIWTCQRLIS